MQQAVGCWYTACCGAALPRSCDSSSLIYSDMSSGSLRERYAEERGATTVVLILSDGHAVWLQHCWNILSHLFDLLHVTLFLFVFLYHYLTLKKKKKKHIIFTVASEFIIFPYLNWLIFVFLLPQKWMGR